MKLRIPGKTFLLGEYSALVGGSVIGLATAPGFSVQYETASGQLFPFSFPFSSQSPAGVLWNLVSKNSRNLKINFDDQYNGVGGFGKSTAEYLSVLLPHLQQMPSSYSEVETNYRTHSKISGAEVSGKDLAIQYFGKVMKYDQASNTYSSTNWKFPELEFFLISTGLKIPTHQHLQTLKLADLSRFVAISDQGIKAYNNGSATDFVTGLSEWSEFLDVEGFLADKAREIKVELEQDPDILCAKPCGAMGADVVLVLCASEKSEIVKSKLVTKNFSIKGCSADLIQGVEAQLSLVANKSAGGLHVD